MVVDMAADVVVDVVCMDEMLNDVHYMCLKNMWGNSIIF